MGGLRRLSMAVRDKLARYSGRANAALPRLIRNSRSPLAVCLPASPCQRRRLENFSTDDASKFKLRHYPSFVKPRQAAASFGKGAAFTNQWLAARQGRPGGTPAPSPGCATADIRALAPRGAGRRRRGSAGTQRSSVGLLRGAAASAGGAWIFRMSRIA